MTKTLKELEARKKELMKNPDKTLGQNIITIAREFRTECIKNDLDFATKDFLVGYLFGTKVEIKITYNNARR